MNNYEYDFTGINMNNHANTINVIASLEISILVLKLEYFFPTGFFFLSIYDKQALTFNKKKYKTGIIHEYSIIYTMDIQDLF